MSALWDMEPAYIILYDADVGMMRQIEVFQAERPEDLIRVFLLFYVDSFEDKKYLMAVRDAGSDRASLLPHRGKAHGTMALVLIVRSSSMPGGPGGERLRELDPREGYDGRPVGPAISGAL